MTSASPPVSPTTTTSPSYTCWPFTTPGVLGGAGAAPAAGLDLELLALVGQLEEAGRALEELAAEVGEETEGVDVGVELVDHAGELLHLGRCVELRLVAHEVLEAAVGLRALRGQLEEVELRADVDGRRRHAEPGRHHGAVAVELGAEQSAEATAREVVVDLEGEGALARAHRPVREPQHGHAHRSYTSVVHRGSPKVPLADDGLAERPDQATELVAALLPERLPGRQGEGVGAVLDLLAEGGAGLGEGAVGRRRTRARRGSRPTPSHDGVVPLARSLEGGAGHLTGRGVEHERVDPVEARLHEAGDVAVAAELAQQRDGVPEREHRLVGPRQGGVAGVQRTTGRRCTPSAAVRASSAARGTDGSSRRSPAARRRACRRRVEARRQQRLRRGRVPRRGDGVVDDGGVEVEERGDDDLGRHRAHRRRARGEVAVEAHHAERLVGRRRLGREVDHPVVRLEGPPHLPRHHRFHGGGP